MATTSARTIQQLERELARLRQRLARDEHDAGSVGFLGGFVLGALAGGVLALVFATQAGDQTRAQMRGAGDAILLRGRAGEPGATQASAEAPASASTAMLLSVPATPARVDESAASVAPAENASASGAETATSASANPVMASPAPPAPASAAESLSAKQPAAGLPPSLPGEGGHCPYTHPIKGNKNSNGELIYHLPGTRFYERTDPEVCFATEADAQAAGFRAAKG